MTGIEKKQQCYRCKSFTTSRRNKTRKWIWLHLPDDKSHLYCSACYDKDRYQRHRKEILAYSKRYYQKHRKHMILSQREYQRERYERLRPEILENRRCERDKSRKYPFIPRSVS